MSIKKYSQFISLHEQKTKTIGLRSASIKEAASMYYKTDDMDSENKERFNNLKRNMKNDNIPHHSGEHHAGVDYGDNYVEHAGHYGGHHVSVGFDENAFSHRTNAPKPKHIQKEVKKQNPHVSSEIHQKFTDDIVNFHNKEDGTGKSQESNK